MGLQDFQPLSSVSHVKGHEGLNPKSAAKKIGVRVLPPYPDASKKEADLNANSRLMHEALEHAPHAKLHQEVSSTNSRLKSAAKALGTSIMHGFGRSGAFIAGTIVAAITKVIAFSSCLTTGGVSGLIMIPAAGIKAAIKMGENFQGYEQRIGSMKEKQKKSSERDPTASQIRMLHYAGMLPARALEPLCEKLFAYALGRSNEKITKFNQRTDEVLGKGGSGIGIGTGTAISVAGLGIGAILGSVVGAVTLLGFATDEARNGKGGSRQSTN